MQLVIDIPEILLDRIKSAKCVPDMYGSDIVNAVVCIRDGIPYEERPCGEWINEDYGIGLCFAECSECGEETEGYAKENGFGFDYSFPNFCPNCGASMVKKEGEEK